MFAKLKFSTLALVVSLSVSGCCCAPKEMFSWIDRHCFYADWTSHYNCVNRTCYGGCGGSQCQHPVVAHEGEMLVLGNVAQAEATIE